jgi:hypothetical protein
MQCVSDIYNIKHVDNGRACSIEMHASRWEVLDPSVMEDSSVKFELAIKGQSRGKDEQHFQIDHNLYAPKIRCRIFDVLNHV